MSCRKPCARNVLWKQLETPKTSESNFSVSNKMFRCIIFVTICSSSFEFPEKNRDVSFSTSTYMYLCIQVPITISLYIQYSNTNICFLCLYTLKKRKVKARQGARKVLVLFSTANCTLERGETYPQNKFKNHPKIFETCSLCKKKFVHVGTPYRMNASDNNKLYTKAM